jgi:hypothetical protein
MESTRQLEAEVPPQEEGRVVRNLGVKIPPGEFLVYYLTSPESVRCDPEGRSLDGTNEAGRLFRSLENARVYASTKAASSGLIGTGVYDHSWRIVTQFESPESLRREARKRQPGRLLLWSTTLLFAGAILFWWEIRSGWTLMVGFLIGSRLLFSGSLKLAQAIRAAHQVRKCNVDARGRDQSR